MNKLELGEVFEVFQCSLVSYYSTNATYSFSYHLGVLHYHPHSNSSNNNDTFTPSVCNVKINELFVTCCVVKN